MKRFISHVQLPVNHLEDSVDWYVKYLNCTFIANFGDFAIVELSEGANINLWKTEDITNGNFTVNGKMYPTIGIEVDDINELINAIKESGSNFEGDGTSTQGEEGRNFFHFYDLNGNMIVAHEEPNSDCPTD